MTRTALSAPYNNKILSYAGAAGAAAGAAGAAGAAAGAAGAAAGAAAAAENSRHNLRYRRQSTKAVTIQLQINVVPN